MNVLASIKTLIKKLEENSHTNFSKVGTGTVLLYKKSENKSSDGNYNDLGLTIGSKIEISNFSGTLGGFYH